jgi:phosphoribosylanthranilate isomerase
VSVDVKICGIHDEAGLRAAVEGGAKYIGLVFYAKSKNAITPEEARKLAAMVPSNVIKTGLFVDAEGTYVRAIAQTIPLNMIQLHGVETPQMVAEIGRLTRLPVMKALRMRTEEDLKAVPAYEAVADRLLFDSRIGNEPSGGPINWDLLKGRTFKKPWVLAGGLNTHNLSEAVHTSGARAVDVSSGVEDRPGHKSPDKIRAFLTIAAKL